MINMRPRPPLSRRRFLSTVTAATMAGHVALDGRHPMIAGAVETAKRLPAPVHVTDIEVHEITVPYRDWIAGPLNHYYGPTRRTVYVAHTDNGLTGLGESGGPESPDVIEQYIGTNPFDHVMGTGLFNLDMACYDLMGKHLGLPAWKLMGQQTRQWVSMGWWMPSSPWQKRANILMSP